MLPGSPMSNPAEANIEQWNSALDELQADLGELRQALDDENPELPALNWQPPTGLGPLPAALAPRAQQLVVDLDLAQRHLETLRNAIGTELSETSARNSRVKRAISTPSDTPAPRLIDHSA